MGTSQSVSKKTPDFSSLEKPDPIYSKATERSKFVKQHKYKFTPYRKFSGANKKIIFSNLIEPFKLYRSLDYSQNNYIKVFPEKIGADNEG